MTGLRFHSFLTFTRSRILRIYRCLRIPSWFLFLWDQYRREHLEQIVPDVNNGEAPGGNWYELIGSAYDRAAYALEVETSAAQDRAFIAAYNARPNRSHFHTVSRNCADFAKDVINFYYPKSLHRSIVADAGITTPKQMAITMVKFVRAPSRVGIHALRHPTSSRQCGTQQARSTGWWNRFSSRRNTSCSSVVVSPIFAGCVAAVYVGSGAGRFDPSQHALIYNAERGLESPVQAAEDLAIPWRYWELTHLVGDEAGVEPDPCGEESGSPAEYRRSRL